MKGAAAEKAGVKAGDVIVRVGDAKVATPADLTSRLRAGRGQSAGVTVVRERKELNLTLALDGYRPGEQ
jgi:S1-C subfamily serine protease